MAPFSLKQLFHVLSKENMSEGGGGGSLLPDWDFVLSVFHISHCEGYGGIICLTVSCFAFL